jgi:protein-L-isoaspartate(D-aspartate) O-methyltransferase
MSQASTPAEIARKNMVDSQVRPNQVNDARVITAMRHLPRELFAPAGANPYTDADIALGGGRYMLAPLTIARLTQLVLAANPAHILVIAAGSGYGAAILAGAVIGQDGAAVTALESEPRLQSATLSAIAPAIIQATGPLGLGWPATGPYDAILIEGAVTEIPASLAGQLVPGGRIIAILADTSAPVGLGRIVIAQPSGGQFAVSPVFDCTARILPEFQPSPAFSF